MWTRGESNARPTSDLKNIYETYSVLPQPTKRDLCGYVYRHPTHGFTSTRASDDIATHYALHLAGRCPLRNSDLLQREEMLVRGFDFCFCSYRCATFRNVSQFPSRSFSKYKRRRNLSSPCATSIAHSPTYPSTRGDNALSVAILLYTNRTVLFM